MKYSTPLEIENLSWRKDMRALIVTVNLFVVSLFVLAAVAPVRELAVAPGFVVPSDPVVVLQHPEGGIVANVSAREGDIVEKGQEILSFAPVAASSDLGQLQAREAYLQLEALRLSALINETPMETPKSSKFITDKTLEMSKVLYTAERNALKTQLEAYETRIERRTKENEDLDNEIGSIQRQISLYQQQVNIRSSLSSRQLGTKTSALEAAVELEEARRLHTQTTNRKEQIVSEIAQAESDILQLKAERFREWSLKLGEVESNLAETQEAIRKQADRLERTVITSPVRGIVQVVSVSSANEVVDPGKEIARIVPIGEVREIEVTLDPQDVPYIKLGQSADIIVTAFDKELFGEITGEVSFVSPTTFQNEEGHRFYKAKLVSDRVRGTIEGKEYEILPGMTVQANIPTGEKSVVQYLMKPVYRALEHSFSER
jgi:membrane fusion protein, adhesin transport system